MKQLERRGTLPEWYEGMVSDCKAIITEGEFTARWALVECYHQLGQRILAENDNFNRASIYGEKIVSRVAKSLGVSSRKVYRAVQFAQKYPTLDPFNKSTSWHEIVNHYLPEPHEDVAEPVEACRHCPLHCGGENA